jgi:hypothetical protein
MDTESPKEKKCLYDEYMEEQCQKAEALYYGGKVSSHQLQTGLQITLVSHNERDVVIGEVKVILH